MTTARTLLPTWNASDPIGQSDLAAQPTLEALFVQVAHRPEVAGRTVLVDGDTRFEATELAATVRRLAGGLRGLGVRRGDVVAFQVPSWWETIVLYRACWRLGAIAAPIHHLGSVADVEQVCRDLVPRLLFAAPDLAAATVPEASQIRGDGAYESLLDADEYDQIDAEPTDLAVVLFTSGSTGTPKGVMHTHRALAYKARSLVAAHGIDERDVVLMPAPLAHVSGLSNAILVPSAGGLRSVLMDRWNPAAANELVAREGVTFMQGPPTFFQTMMAAPNFTREAVASVRLISCGGAGVTPAFVQSASEAFGATVKRTYGSTEAPIITTWHAGDPIERAGSFDGRAIGSVRLRVVDAAGHDVEAGESGELWVQGPELFVGYTDAARNDSSITPDDWFRTGDLATVEDGWLRIVGRIKDIIIRGGENISAAEVEGVLEAHPVVRQAVAVGFPDERLGERVCAYVVTTGEFDLDACRAWFADHGVTKFKWPERVVCLDELPVLGSSGKADRAALRERAHRAAAEHG